jgi:hypothetical protein
MPLEELPDAALANYYADQICGIIHEHPVHETRLFPEWMPNLDAGLLHQGQLVTKKQESHIITALTAPDRATASNHERLAETRPADH